MTLETSSLSNAAPVSLAATRAWATQRLTNSERREVLGFLSQRPLSTFVMSGFILDNGLESDLNRGIFYGCRDAAGALEGAALIGHAIYIEARTERALREFARIAEAEPETRVILGEREMIERLATYYAGAGHRSRFCRELLFELTSAVSTLSTMDGLRPATLDELDLTASVHAALALEEGGTNPLERDPEGFRRRCRRRIEQGRTWVLIEHGELIFKIDIISETPEVIYLEGIFVNPKYRGAGFGSRCLSQLSRQLLQRTKFVTALVNEENRDAAKFFEKLGFVSTTTYDTIFLQPKNQRQAQRQRDARIDLRGAKQ